MPMYHGRDGVVYMSTSATGTASRVLTLTAWTMDRTVPRVDVTNFDSTNQEEMQGWPALRGTYEGYWNSDESKLFAATTSADGVKLYLYPSARIPSKFMGTLAWVDASMETRVDGVSRVRGTWSAYGSQSVINL